MPQTASTIDSHNVGPDDASFIGTLRQIATFCALDDASPYGIPYAPADYRDAFNAYAADE